MRLPKPVQVLIGLGLLAGVIGVATQPVIDLVMR